MVVLASFLQAGGTEVPKMRVEICVQHHVAGLDVTMEHAFHPLLEQILHCCRHTCKDGESQFPREYFKCLVLGIRWVSPAGRKQPFIQAAVAHVVEDRQVHQVSMTDLADTRYFCQKFLWDMLRVVVESVHSHHRP